MDRSNLHCSFYDSWGWQRYSQIPQKEVNNDHVIFAKFVYFLLENL